MKILLRLFRNRFTKCQNNFFFKRIIFGFFLFLFFSTTFGIRRPIYSVNNKRDDQINIEKLIRDQLLFAGQIRNGFNGNTMNESFTLRESDKYLAIF